MKRILFAFFIVILGVSFFSACSSKKTSADVGEDDQPLWVTGDPSSGDETGIYLYFVGRNAVVDANRTRPSRSAYMSAENDAKRQYVEYMETLVQSKANEALTAAGDNLEGSQSVGAFKSLIKTFAQKTVTGIKRYDEYFVSTEENSAGLPLWNVWLRMRVEKKFVQERFDLMTSNIQKKAAEGVEGAKELVKAVQTVQKEIKKDDFFDGF